MVTDEMVEKAVLSLYGSDFYDNWDRNTSHVVNREVGIRAALESALSAAEPQPAPSVAVQALQWIVAHPEESNAVVWDVAKNALSAQVQDVETVTHEPTNGILAAVHLISVFADDMNERNWDDKRAYIKHQADRVRAAMLADEALPAAPAKQEG